MKVIDLDWEAQDVDKTVWSTPLYPAGSYTVVCVGPEKWEARTRGPLLVGGGPFTRSKSAKEACQRHFHDQVHKCLA